MSKWLVLKPSLEGEKSIEELSKSSESLSWKGEKPPSGTLADDWNNNPSPKWLHYEQGEWLDKLRDEIFLAYPDLNTEMSFYHSENGVIWPIGSEMKCTCPSDFCSEAAKAGFYQIYLSISDKQDAGKLMAKAEVEIVQEMTWTDTWSWKFGLAAIKKAELSIQCLSFKTKPNVLCKALDNFLLDLATIHMEGLGRWEIFDVK